MASLRHPLFWCSLAALLLNDHVLKHAGVLPGALTGKLSDFAGLIVAPVLAAALLRARGPLARALAFALPTVPFMAINLSSAAAAAMEAATAAIGMPWRIWTDPTDLVALAVLPVAWHVSAEAPKNARPRALERVAVVLAAFACMATSPPPPEELPVEPGLYTSSTYLSNRTGDTLDVRVRWLDADVDCEAVLGMVDRTLDPDLFGSAITFRLIDGENVPLDRGPASTAAGLADVPTPTLTDCDVALIQADGLDATLVVLGQTLRSFPATGVGTGASGQVSIVPDGSRLRAEASDVTLAAAIERPAPSACFDDAVQSFEVSVAGLPSIGSYKVVSREIGADGCLAIELTDDLHATPYAAFLCIPEWAFPFDVDDRVFISVEGTRLVQVREEHEDGTFGTTIEVLSIVDAGFVAGRLSGRLEPDGCTGERLSCDAYVRSVTLQLSTEGETLTVRPGDVVSIGEIDGQNVALALGRAEEVIVAHPTCEPHRRQLGAHADIVLLYEEVVR